MREGWSYKIFEDALQKVKYTPKLQTNEFLQEGNYPIISQEEEFISGYTNKEEFVFKTDCPLVIFGDHTRVLKYVDFDFVLGADGVKILKPQSDLKVKFLLYYLKWYKVPSLGYSRHYKLLKEILLPVPPLSTQQQIVEELDLLSGIIEKQKAQLKELDSLAQSLFYDMFGDPVTNEKGWEVKKLGEVFDISSGGTPSTNIRQYWEGGTISWIGSNMCQNKVIRNNDGKFITKEGLEHSNAKIYTKGFVLVALVGATIGKVALLDFDSTTNQNIAGINVPANNNYTSFFVFYLVQSLYCLFESIGEGKFKMANLSFVRALPIITPPLPLQQQFAERVASIEHQKTLIQQQLKETETLFNSRMDYYFN